MGVRNKMLYTMEVLERIGLAIDRVPAKKFVDDIINVTRHQTLIDKKWTTICYEIVSPVGGPDVLIDGCREEIVGRGEVEGQIRMKFTPLAKRGYKRVAEILDELV